MAAVLPDGWVSPSVAYGGLSVDEERRLRYEGTLFIDVLVGHLKLEDRSGPNKLQCGAHYFFQLFFCHRSFRQERWEVVGLSCILLIAKVFDQTRQLDPILTVFLQRFPNLVKAIVPEAMRYAPANVPDAVHPTSGAPFVPPGFKPPKCLKSAMAMTAEGVVTRECREMLRAQVIKCESLLIRALQFEFDEPTKAAFELLDKFCRKVPEVFANQCRDKSGVRAGSGVESSDNSAAAANLATESIRSPESDASSIAGRSSTPGAPRGGRGFSGAGGIGVYGGGRGASSGSSLFTAFGAGSGAGRSGFGTVEGGSIVGAATPGGRNGGSTTATHSGAFGAAARKRAADDEDDDIPFVGRKKRSSANPLLAPATSAQQPHNSQMSSASSAVSSRSAPPSRSGAAGAGTRLPDAIQVEIRRRAVSFLFDAHRSVMPLKYTPRVLALGCLKLALKFVAKRTGVGGLAALDLCALDRKVVIQSRRGTEGFVDWASNQIGDVGADFNVILKVGQQVKNARSSLAW